MTIKNSLRSITFHDALQEISRDKKLYGIASLYARKYGISVSNAIQEMAQCFTMCHSDFIF